MQYSKRIIVVVNSGSGGDQHPMLAIALALQSRGHDVRVSGDAAAKESLRNSGIMVSMRPKEREFEAYVMPWRKKVDEIGCFMQILTDNPASIQVLIDRLREAKDLLVEQVSREK